MRVTDSRSDGARRVRRYLCDLHGPMYTDEQEIDQRAGRRALALLDRMRHERGANGDR